MVARSTTVFRSSDRSSTCAVAQWQRGTVAQQHGEAPKELHFGCSVTCQEASHRTQQSTSFNDACVFCSQCTAGSGNRGLGVMKDRHQATTRKRKACKQLRALAFELGVPRVGRNADLKRVDFQSLLSSVMEQCQTPEHRERAEDVRKMYDAEVSDDSRGRATPSCVAALGLATLGCS